MEKFTYTEISMALIWKSTNLSFMNKFQPNVKCVYGPLNNGKRACEDDGRKWQGNYYQQRSCEPKWPGRSLREVEAITPKPSSKV